MFEFRLFFFCVQMYNASHRHTIITFILFSVNFFSSRFCVLCVWFEPFFSSLCLLSTSCYATTFFLSLTKSIKKRTFSIGALFVLQFISIINAAFLYIILALQVEISIPCNMWMSCIDTRRRKKNKKLKHRRWMAKLIFYRKTILWIFSKVFIRYAQYFGPKIQKKNIRSSLDWREI